MCGTVFLQNYGKSPEEEISQSFVEVVIQGKK